MSQTPPQAAAYLKTRVTVFEEGAWVEAHHSRLLAHGPFHVLTAWNPLDARCSEAENRAADERMRVRIEALGRTPWRSVGHDPDSPHHEEGWAVSGLDDASALRLGAEFDQHAIFRITATTQEVIASDDTWRVSRPLP